MAQIKKDTSLRKAILQAAITGQLISDIGGESDVLFSNEKKSKTKLDSEADLLLASRVSKRNSVVSDSERTTPSPRGYAPKTPNEFASFENQNSVSERSERPTLPETGKQLLDRIIEERNNKLLADWEEKQTDLFASNDAHSKNAKTVRSEQIRLLKKAKKPAPVVASEIDEEEIPFEIPENWCWCRIDDLFSHNTGKALNKSENKEGTELEYITTSNLYWNYFELDNLKTMLFKDSEIEKCTVQKGDLLVCEGGEVGRTAIWNFDRTICIQNHIHRLRAYEASLNKSFYYFVMFLYKEGKLIDDYAKGIGIKGLSSNALGSIIIPLPPISVQNAIVAKLEQVLPLVDAYENALLQKEELKSALPDKIKKAILQEAITGQLTEAWRKSATIKESGKQLLDRIIEERNAKALADWEDALKKNVGGKATLPSFASKTRAKKPVPVIASEIDEEEIPFEVPESWCWCRLGDLGDFVRGSGIKRDETRSEGFPCIRYGEMYTRYKTVINETASFVDKNVFDKCQKIIKNDIAMALTGENEYDIALAAVYTGDKEIAMGGDMTRFRPAFVNSLFLVFALNSPYGIECKSELATGNIIVHISNDKLGSIMIPLPPLEEQEEIVKKVEELLLLCK